MNETTLPVADGRALSEGLGCVAVQELWLQTSSDYQAVKSTRSLKLHPYTTVAEIAKWARSGQCMQRGDVIITDSEQAA